MAYIVFIVAYGVVSIALTRIARRTNASRPRWFAWVPVLRDLLVLGIAKKGWRWLVLMLIPGVNVWAAWVVWGEVARTLGRSVWWGRAMVFPVVNAFVLLVLAYAWRPQSWPARLRQCLRDRLTHRHNPSFSPQ